MKTSRHLAPPALNHRLTLPSIALASTGRADTPLRIRPRSPSTTLPTSVLKCPAANGAVLHLRTPRWLTFPALLTLMATFLVQTLLAQGWYTVDDFQYSPGLGAFANGLAKDSTGTIIYSAGQAYDASVHPHALAFKSGDGGTNWSTMDDYSAASDAGITSDSAGNIYVAGNGYLGWFTRRSTDGGITWSTVDTLSFSGGYASPYALATDAGGNVYVVGQIQTNAAVGGSAWIVRKGTGGTYWATVAQSGPQTNNPNWTANGVFCHRTAGIFVVGQATVPVKRNLVQLWNVRRSRDGGATWSTVDTYPGPLYSSDATGIGADSAGNLYVVGWATAQSSDYDIYHWTVRKSGDGGNSWATVDDFVYPASNSSRRNPIFGDTIPSAFGSDANDNLFVAGYYHLGNGLSWQWSVRRSQDGGATWATVDAFQYVSGQDSFPYAVVGDSSGHIFVAGTGTDANGQQHWLVRKH